HLHATGDDEQRSDEKGERARVLEYFLAVVGARPLEVLGDIEIEQRALAQLLDVGVVSDVGARFGVETRQVVEAFDLGRVGADDAHQADEYEQPGKAEVVKQQGAACDHSFNLPVRQSNGIPGPGARRPAATARASRAPRSVPAARAAG